MAIFRGITERFNPQIHTEEKSLTVNMNKHFEVKKKTFDLFASKNKFVSWMYATGRYNMGIGAKKVMSARESISDNAYRVQYQGSLFIPAYAFGKTQIGTVYTASDDMSGLTGTVAYTGGVTSTTVGHNVVGSLAVKHDPDNNIFGDKFNEGDVIALGDYRGSRLIVMGTPRKASSGDHYIVNFKVNSIAALFDEAALADGELLPEAGNRFGEGSMRGYQRERRNLWKINYSFITRASLTLTGSAMSQNVAVISSDSGAKMWEYEQVLDLHERHSMNVELGARYARSSMDVSSHKWFEDYGTNRLTLDGFTADYGIVAPVIGDGWISQLDDSLTIDYDPNNPLSAEVLQMFMTILAQRAPGGSTGNHFVILGDKLAHMKIDETLKQLVGFTPDTAKVINHNTNVVMNVKTGQNNKVGFEVSEYYYLGNSFTFIEDNLMNHPAFASQNGGIVGTGIMYFMNASMVNGVSNIDLISRKDRFLRQKYIDGLHSLDPKRNNVGYAASGFDGGRVDLLSEVLAVIYSTESCGILKPSAKFTGGVLAGTPAVVGPATKWHY